MSRYSRAALIAALVGCVLRMELLVWDAPAPATTDLSTTTALWLWVGIGVSWTLAAGLALIAMGAYGRQHFSEWRRRRTAA